MDFEQQLRTAFAPCDPRPELASTILARRSALIRSRGKSSRGRRTILFGAILAVAAAAAMLAAHLLDQPAIQTVAAVPAQEPVPVPAALAEASLLPASPAPELVQEKVAPVEAVAAQPFTVSIGLQNQAKDAANPAVEAFYAALLSELRAVRGLTLIEAGGGTAPAAADYRLLVTGTGPVASSRFATTIAVLLDTGTTPSRGYGGGGEIADPVAGVASMVDYVRSEVLPPDPAYQQRLRGRLLDSTQDPRQRMQALTGLFSRARSPAGANVLALDSASLRGAIDLASSTATDPGLRAQVWRKLRGVGSAELLPALGVAVRNDPNVEVSLQALATLSADFRDDARGRATLESVVREDKRLLLRALAQRALTGDAPWKQYIVSSLQDTTRPAAGRIEAFAYQMYGISPGSSNNYGGDRKLLDDEMIQALSPVLPEVMNLPNLEMMKFSLPRDLIGSGPAGVVAVLGMVKQSSEPELRSAIVNQLTQSSGAPPVRTVLEKVSADNPDPQLRQIAADVLKSAPPADASISVSLRMVLGMMKQGRDDVESRARRIKQVAERSRDPSWHAALEKISTSDPDEELRQFAADVLKSAAAQ